MSKTTDAEERRTQILRAAVDVFGERGYSNATISDIARAAGVAHGTVYLYFSSKIEIFQTLVSWFADRLVSDISGPDPNEEPSASRTLESDLYRLFYRALSLSSQYSQLSKVCMAEATAGRSAIVPSLQRLKDVLAERLSQRFQEAVIDGEISGLPTPNQLFLVVRLLGVSIERAVDIAPDGDVEGLARDVVSLILQGIGYQPLCNNSSPIPVEEIECHEPTLGTTGLSLSPPCD